MGDMTSSPTGTPGNPLANGHVREAIELLRDYGITPEQYAAADLTAHWAVPGHERTYDDEREALAAAQRRADHMLQPVTVTRMYGASGDFAPLDSRRVHPRLGDPTPYALYATRTGGEPIATVDVDGVVNWPAGEHPGDDASDARAPFVMWAGPPPVGDTVVHFGEWDTPPAVAGETWRSTDAADRG
jgi:hypothetical protein